MPYLTNPSILSKEVNIPFSRNAIKQQSSSIESRASKKSQILYQEAIQKQKELINVLDAQDLRSVHARPDPSKDIVRYLGPEKRNIYKDISEYGKTSGANLHIPLIN